MGGSTNTVLHLLAMAQEAGVDFTMADIDRLSRKIPCTCKVAPASQQFHLEDVSRAGGIPTIMAQLARGGLVHTDTLTVTSQTLGELLNSNDLRSPAVTEEAITRALVAPGGERTSVAFAQNKTYDKTDTDAENGCIHSVEHAYSKDGGLAVLFGNIATDGCIVKSAGVDASVLVFSGPARIFESQDDACEAILGDHVVAGDIVVIRYEGPKGGPGMQEMLYPTSYIKAKSLGVKCALLTDGRFSGGTSGLSIGHVSPALQAYAAMTTSAARGAVRDVTQVLRG